MDALEGLVGTVALLFLLTIVVLMLVAQWKIYEKAGKPGWAAIIPIYNMVVLLEIVGKPIWWIILFFVPLVNIVIAIIVVHELSKSFGKDAGFTIGLILVGVIFYPILGFGKDQYIGPGGHAGEPVAEEELV